MIRIKGEGMPKHHTPSEYGDLTITFSVEFPKEARHARMHADLYIAAHAL